MYKCHNCGKVTKSGSYDYTGKFTCAECKVVLNQYHFNVFNIVNEKVEVIEPSIGNNSNEERQYVIDYIYKIFNNNLNPAAYSLLNHYINKKGYTYLGVLKAIEYFYVIKKNSIVKSKNNIGIVPYVYDEAQQYYKQYNKFLHQKYLKVAAYSESQENRVVRIEEEAKQNTIDMTEL